MEHGDQLNLSWTIDVRTIWVWEVLYGCQQTCD